jgi:NADH-quinone oxidoreductase subunit M
VGVIYDRAHHRDLNGFGGLAKVLPVYTGFSGLAFMAALGLPGLSGFIGEALVFLGAFQTHRIATIISASGVILAACYVLWTIHRVFLGPLKNEDYAHYSDLNFREWASLVPLAIPVIVLGFYPMPVLDLMSATLGALKDFVLMAR